MATIICELSGDQNRALSNRYQAKRFTHTQDMHAFLNKGDNSMHWRQIKDDLKSGIYFSRMTRKDGKMIVEYIDEKSLR